MIGAQKLVLLVLLCAAALCPAWATSPWPRVESLDRRLEIAVSDEVQHVSVPVLSMEGRPLYWFRCLAGTTESLDTMGEKDGNNYVAPLACVLVDKADGWQADLLSEDDSAVWYSRGQYTGSDLTGECARYPQFGITRDFRLRGMRLTLVAENVVNLDRQHAGPSTMTLHVTIKPDPTARTAQAERPGFQPPKLGECHKVIKGNAPLMCRNPTTLSWQECSTEQKQAMGYP